jgi:predicted ATPase/DNA-binding winged helix-turn-helix (wHTH) protein
VANLSLSSTDKDVAYEFGEFRFEPENARLLRGGALLHAEPKALQVLAVLIAAAGNLVERDALLDAVWGRVVVTPGTLTRLIAELRRLLEDEPAEPRFIATVHTRGYRWVAQVSAVGGNDQRRRLPERSVTLIGRESDLAALTTRLAAHRLVTLLGPGGTGKTQLALELGRRREGTTPQSAVWADLSTAVDALGCGQIVAANIEASEREDLAVEAMIARVIADRELLLVLDNCERVTRVVGALVRTLLARCGRLRILVTSQFALDLPEETLFHLAPLALPPPGWELERAPLDVLRQAASVRLLIERAQAVLPTFVIDGANARSLAEICRQLDGLPLALELAAARLATMSPQQLLAALDDRFALLARQVAAPDARHASLRGAIDWSYGLLEPGERELLDISGVFAGSFSADALVAVSGALQAGRFEVYNRVQSLVQKSLLTVERTPHEARYRLLDSVRAFARAQLAAGGGEAERLRRHAEFYARLALDADAELLGIDQLVWMDRLSTEWPNLKSAFEWARAPGGDPETAADLVTGLRWHFWIRGLYAEAGQWMRDISELAKGLSDIRLARLLNGTAIALWHQARVDEALTTAEQAAQLAERGAAFWEHGFALALTAWITGLSGDWGRTERATRMAQATRTGMRDFWLEGLAGMGSVFCATMCGEHAEALERIEEVSAQFERAEDRHMRMFVSAQRALQLFLLNRPFESGKALITLYGLASALENARGLTTVCEGTGYLASAAGDGAVATFLLGAAEGGRLRTGAPQFVHWQNAHATAKRQARNLLEGAAFESAWREGVRVGPRGATGTALEYLDQQRARGGLNKTGLTDPDRV